MLVQAAAVAGSWEPDVSATEIDELMNEDDLKLIETIMRANKRAGPLTRNAVEVCLKELRFYKAMPSVKQPSKFSDLRARLALAWDKHLANAEGRLEASGSSTMFKRFAEEVEK